MTAAELRAQLAQFPANTPIYVTFEQEIPVLDRFDDTIMALPIDVYPVTDCKTGEEWTGRRAFRRTVLLTAENI